MPAPRNAGVARKGRCMRKLAILAAASMVLAVGCMDRNSSESSDSKAFKPSDRATTKSAGDNSATAKGTGATSETDRNFVNQAASGGMFEVKSSELALQRLAMQQNSSSELRDFAQMMIDDHGKANKELERIAKQKDIEVSDRMLPEQQQAYDKLVSQTGSDFNKRYYKDQVEAHDDAIGLFQKAARDLQDPELREFAQRTLPTLQEHRNHLKEHEKAWKGD